MLQTRASSDDSHVCMRVVVGVQMSVVIKLQLYIVVRFCLFLFLFGVRNVFVSPTLLETICSLYNMFIHATIIRLSLTAARAPATYNLSVTWLLSGPL